MIATVLAGCSSIDPDPPTQTKKEGGHDSSSDEGSLWLREASALLSGTKKVDTRVSGQSHDRSNQSVERISLRASTSFFQVRES